MDKARKQQFIIKVCCVIAAFVLWLFITSTENPLTTYKIKNIPVQLLNTDTLTRSNLVLVPGQDLTTSLNIKGANTSILLNTKAEDFKVVADLSEYALKSGEQNIPIEIRKSPDNVNVANSDSLFIKINLDDLKQTKLPISVNISGKPKEGFFASAPKISQDYATVVGGSKFVDLVKNILVEENIQGVESNVAKKYKLKPVDAAGEEIKEVNVSPSQIDVKIPVSKTKSVGVTVKTTGTLNSNFTLSSTKVIPEKFDVTGSAAALNQVKTLNTEDIDLSKIEKSTTMDAKLLIPDGLTLASGNATTQVQFKLDKVVQKNTTEVIQKNTSQNIKYVNLDEKYGAKLGNDKVSLVLSGTQAVIDSLDLTKISAQVDLSNLVEGSYTVPVKVSMPDGVNLVSEAPDKISVTITKKQTEVTTSNDNKGK
ncbi:MAG TPA: CdaR family protein [Clostridium sp.]